MDIKYRPCYTTRITSGFEWRLNPTTRVKEHHNGIDISPLDKIKYLHEPIVAIADGEVSLAYTSSVIGVNVQIMHSGGYISRNFHLNSRVVKQGDKIKAGQLIGFMGTTGQSTGQHLHFEIRKLGKPINPYPLIMDKPFEVIGGEDLTREDTIELIKEILIARDSKPSKWAEIEWKNATAKRIVDGSRPKGYATREEVIAIINNIK